MNFRRLLLLAGLLGIGLVIIANLGSYGRFSHIIIHVRWYVFVLVAVIQLVSYYCNARYYQTFFAISGHTVPLRRLYETALGINFANQAIPAGGAAGATYLAGSLTDYVPAGKAALAQLFRYVFTFVTFLAVLILGFLLLLFFGGNIGQVSVRIIILLISTIILIGLVVAVVFSDRHRAQQLVRPLINGYNRLGIKLLGSRFHPTEPERLTGFLDEFYSGLDELLSSHKQWLRPLIWALGGNLAEVATIYAVFAAFGHFPNPGVVIVGYTLANLASLLAVFTAGIGVYEATMIATFSSLGIPIALGFSVVVVYRVINLSLFLPPGFYFYRQHLAEKATS